MRPCGYPRQRGITKLGECRGQARCWKYLALVVLYSHLVDFREGERDSLLCSLPLRGASLCEASCAAALGGCAGKMI